MNFQIKIIMKRGNKKKIKKMRRLGQRNRYKNICIKWKKIKFKRKFRI